MLDRGFTIFRVRGIPVRLHVTLLLVLPYAAWVSANEFEIFARRFEVNEDALLLPTLVWGALLAIGLFVSILVHELAHSFVALRHGVPVRSITLMMLGGISSMDHDDHDHEAWMAFAGPLASFALALASYGLFALAPLPHDVQIAALMFAITNALLGAFNLLPAFPMDGGRVLRGLLAGPLGLARATRIATTLGKIAAVALAALGVAIGNFFLPLIAVFVYIGASAEEKHLGAKEGLRGVPITHFMTDPPTATWLDEAMQGDLPRLSTRDDAASAIEALAGSKASAVVVLDDEERVIGLVTPADAERALEQSLEQQSRRRRA